MVTSDTKLRSITNFVNAIFDLVARLGHNIAVNRVLDQTIDVILHKGPSGRPRQTWLHQIESKSSDLRSAWAAHVRRINPTFFSVCAAMDSVGVTDCRCLRLKDDV